MDLLHLKVICRKDRCLLMEKPILTSLSLRDSSWYEKDDHVETFTKILSADLQYPGQRQKSCTLRSQEHQALVNWFSQGYESTSFELKVINNGLLCTVNWMFLQLNDLKHTLGILIREASSSARSPQEILLRAEELLKSLSGLQTVITQLIASIQHLADHNLSESHLAQMADIELVLENYRVDLVEIHSDCSVLITRLDLLHIQVSSKMRQSKDRVSLLSANIEVCMLGLTFGACIASIFGMNLTSGFEDHPFSFYAILGVIIVSAGVIKVALINWSLHLKGLGRYSQSHILRETGPTEMHYANGSPAGTPQPDEPKRDYERWDNWNVFSFK